MKKQTIVCLLVLLLAGILVLSVTINSKKRELAETTMTADGEAIEDVSQLPIQAQQLLAQYHEANQKSLDNMQKTRGALSLAFLLIAFQYVWSFVLKKETEGH